MSSNDSSLDDYSTSQPLSFDRRSLSPFEQSELMGYFSEDIFYIGSGCNKLCHTLDYDTIIEDAFNDAQGYYIIVIKDHLLYRFEILRTIGKGAYGEVIEAIDHKTNRHVAIKIIRYRGEVFRTKHYSEIERLQYFNELYAGRSSPFVRMLEHFMFRGHPCMVFSLYYNDLMKELILSNFRGLDLLSVRKITRSILKALNALYTHKLVHGDLKPANIVLKKKGRYSIRLVDFGNCHEEHNRPARYMQSRNYRAPEVILRLQYGTGVDIWALGCIAAELYTGKPLFSGRNEADQLSCIMECLGTPPRSYVKTSSMYDRYFWPTGEPRYCTVKMADGTLNQYAIAGSRGPPGSKNLHMVLGKSDCKESKALIDFIRRCLRWNPESRFTPRKGMYHYWFPRREINILPTLPKSHPNLPSTSQLPSEKPKSCSDFNKSNKLPAIAQQSTNPAPKHLSRSKHTISRNISLPPIDKHNSKKK